MTDAPDVVAARDHVRDELVRFARSLRQAGVDVPANAHTTAARALVELGFGDEDRARAGLRACLVTDARDAETFDRLFAEFWRRLTAGLGPTGPADRQEDAPEGALAPMGDPADSERADVDTGEDGASDEQEVGVLSASLGGVVADDAEESGDDTSLGRQSATGVPEPISVPPVESGEAFDRAFDALTAAVGGLRGRRWAGGGDERADARRALRSSFGTGGTVLSVPRRERTRPAVRAVFLVDVSQSVLDTVDRAFLLQFLRRARRDWRDARVFFFDEALREVSGELDAPTHAAVVEALERAEAEWGGGTRIGASLAELDADAVDHRTVVFVVSDGLETGDVDRLESAIAGVSRRAASVLWLNPLAASASYEPTARGMAAALPFVDGLFAFADAADVAELARQLDRHGAGGRVGVEYDPRRA
ncbi:VWA domain-containing protein [Halobacterium litoreum]|uniref:VWA domain-containing protein n=1 Tax=Halobacterium litoreum TaxID=2039234 RepID=A0ABD5NG85_9EURY|nr:VWA domain-containing protein [Halobacterium litoreum]UHH13225.1 VWA domain-containing protein [Halobacterium litoreum]